MKNSLKLTFVNAVRILMHICVNLKEGGNRDSEVGTCSGFKFLGLQRTSSCIPPFSFVMHPFPRFPFTCLFECVFFHYFNARSCQKSNPTFARNETCKSFFQGNRGLSFLPFLHSSSFILLLLRLLQDLGLSLEL